MSRARSLFVGGTSSNAGKSWMTTAICAWLRSRGMSVAPFKAQNMSNHSYPCRAGGEIGRAQVAQAEACGLEPEPGMNPILLKPAGNGRSQVVVRGRAWKTMTAREYYACASALRPVVLEAYEELAARFDAVVIEGAGSVSELNLRQHDLVNLGLVTAIRAPWLLVADVERGGVFASIVGTVSLLEPEERALFRGFAVNRFRGDVSLFEDAASMIETRTAAHCFGIFPYAEDISLDAEDSLVVGTATSTLSPSGASIAIVRVPHLSNATDFRLLTWADWVTAVPARDYDFVILPGTKSTAADLRWLRERGLAEWVVGQHRAGATVIGICGGFQMLGHDIADPLGVEAAGPPVPGLSLLPVHTVMTEEKRTRAVRATTPAGNVFGAYEIHVGHTAVADGVGQFRPFAALETGESDGMRVPRVIGTYLHGAFEDAAVCEEVFGVEMPASVPKAEEYRRLGQWFARHGRQLDRLGFD